MKQQDHVRTESRGRQLLMDHFFFSILGARARIQSHKPGSSRPEQALVQALALCSAQPTVGQRPSRILTARRWIDFASAVGQAEEALSEWRHTCMTENRVPGSRSTSSHRMDKRRKHTLLSRKAVRGESHPRPGRRSPRLEQETRRHSSLPVLRKTSRGREVKLLGNRSGSAEKMVRRPYWHLRVVADGSTRARHCPGSRILCRLVLLVLVLDTRTVVFTPSTARNRQ